MGEKKFGKKIQNLTPRQKKIVIFLVIFLLSLPLFFLAGRNFEKRLKTLQPQSIFKLNIKEFKEKIKSFFPENFEIDPLKIYEPKTNKRNRLY